MEALKQIYVVWKDGLGASSATKRMRFAVIEFVGMSKLLVGGYLDKHLLFHEIDDLVGKFGFVVGGQLDWAEDPD
ncbi:hypothetical protein LBMAG57_29670 [Verrucomicrobiota bacterium]|nr:hypothetical protein LBMAG57_29670 [Verrucomicrobiota bacterium]